MMCSYRSLVDKYERIKGELEEAETSIRRLTGRDPDEIRATVIGSRKFRLGSSATVPGRQSFRNAKRSYNARRFSIEKESSYEEASTSDDESPTKKPALQSTVVAKRHQKRSRKATIEEQNANSKVHARNRRMFGALIGTLQQFQIEEMQRQHQESMRAEIEQKVELANEEERERIKQEKEHLFIARREKKIELRCLEKKIERAESHEVFDVNHRHLLNYIVTKCKPPIFFLPSSHTSATKRALEKSRSKIKEILKKKKESFEKDISEIEESYKRDSLLPEEKKNKLPKEKSESKDVPKTVTKSLIVEKEGSGHDHNSNTKVESNPDPKLNSDSESDINKDEDSNSTKNVDSLADQDFEPIYD